MPRAQYLTHRPIQFERCYKCRSTSGLTTESVGAAQPETGSLLPGVEALTAPLAFFRVLQRESLPVPICTGCRRIFWPLKAGFLLLFVAYLIVSFSMFTTLARICGNTLATWIAVIGLAFVLFAYTRTRDIYQGVQVEQIKNGDFTFKYSVANWCSEDFWEDFAEHRKENPENAG